MDYMGSMRKLYHQLKGEGFSPWLDEEDLLPGQQWAVEIPKAIKSATIFLACLSKTSVTKRSYVQKEFRYALSAYAELPPNSIYLIPARLDDCEVPDLRLPEMDLNLRDLHWVDLYNERGFERLVTAIKHEVTLSTPRIWIPAFPIEEIGDIGPIHGKKLLAVGVTNTKKLLDRCSSVKGRREVAHETGLDDVQLLKWVNLADLMRISGIGKQFSDLLEEAGVDTVKELRNHRAHNLSARMKEINATKNLTRSPPSEKQVSSWVNQAKSLPPLEE